MQPEIARLQCVTDAAKPETAVEMLTKLKLRNMQEEVDKLEQRRVQLTSKLRTMAMPTEKNSPSVEVITMQDRIFMKLSEKMQNAKRRTDVVASLDELRFAYVNRPRKLRERLLGTVKTRARRACQRDHHDLEKQKQPD